MAERKMRLDTFKEALDTCCKTIPGEDARQEAVNVASWGRKYALVKV